MTLPPDIFTAEFHADPYPGWAWLRENAPVYREPRFGSYVLTRFDDVYNALRDHATFSSAAGIGPFGSGGAGGANATIVTSDPPRHTHLRNLVNRAFTPRTVAALEPRMQAIVEQLLAERPGDEFDLVQVLSYPLPMIVIAELLGIPTERRADFKRWSDALIGTFDGSFDEKTMMAVAEMFGYLQGVVAERKDHPGADLLSALTQAEIEGERLSDSDLLAFALVLLVAGNETTTNLISNLFATLATRPDLWQTLRQQRALVPAAVEESLRHDSPVQLLGRGVVKPVEVHGTAIAPGSRVLVAYGAANRDEREFPDAETFRLDRNLARHLAFGHGIHYCLGAPLARAEARIATNALLDRFSRVEPAGPGERTQSAVIHGFHALPLRFR